MSEFEITPPADGPDVGGGYISREELEAILAKRDKEHAEALESLRVRLPDSQVAAHAGGPGVDNHQRSWSLAEQEVSRRGEVLDHWVVK